MSPHGAREGEPVLKTHFSTYFLLVLVTSVLLVACGGSETIVNPDQGGASIAEYSGSPAATDDVRAFQISVWDNLKKQNRCGQCHSEDQNPTFVNLEDINAAYAQVIPYVSLVDPADSLLATKVGGGHNCWLTSDGACATIIENMIINWRGDSSTPITRTIALTAPVITNPGDSKTFPEQYDDNSPNSFEDTIHPLLTEHCQDCHDDSISQPISPFFANADPETAYEAAKPKIDIDTPSISRLVVRLREEFHNCWSGSCEDDATEMQAAIEAFADAITPTVIDTNLVTSKALTLGDGILAAGGNRHESNLVAIWEFKTGSGNTAFDTSGIEPAIDLSLSGNYGWLDEYGLDLSGGKAQADTGPSKKLNDFIKSSGEYSIETWVIPANVTQEDANIISYSAGSTNRNFTLGQALYNYQLYNRSSESDANGVEFLSTTDAGEVLQSSLQHVVASYHPIDGRSIYVNGKLIAVNDPVTVATDIADWSDNYAVVFGNEASNNRSWSGKLRMVAIHNRVLTEEQVVQNFDAGVGQKFSLLFSIAHLEGVSAESYIVFGVSQFDSYSYLFDKPTFINLDPDWTPVVIDIESMRIGINGKEAIAGQAYANLITSIDPGAYTAASGQLLSSMGAVIALEKSSSSDEFFLTFEKLGDETHTFSDPASTAPSSGADADAVPDIGIRTFDEINASIAAITGVPITNTEVDAVFQQYRQQLPSVESIQAFLPSHQMAIAQLALTSCSELVETNSAYFGSFNFDEPASTAFDTTIKRNQILNPLLEAAANVDTAASANSLTTQPDEGELRDMLGTTTGLVLDASVSGETFDGLMAEMQSCLPGCDTSDRTREIVKAVCATTVGSAVMLIQ